MILTAEKFLIDWMGVDNSNHPNEEIRSNFIERKNQLISFAKLHVEAALKAKVDAMKDEYKSDYSIGELDCFTEDAYPLTNIK